MICESVLWCTRLAAPESGCGISKADGKPPIGSETRSAVLLVVLLVLLILLGLVLLLILLTLLVLVLVLLAHFAHLVSFFGVSLHKSAKNIRTGLAEYRKT